MNRPSTLEARRGIHDAVGLTPASGGSGVRMLSRDLATIIALGVFSLALHLVVNALGHFGYFRDELYYLACSRHLSASYVDQPPLSILVLAGARLLLGTSVFAIRVVPAIASDLSV